MFLLEFIFRMAKTKTSFAGARASSAGDEFHILWALRHCLLLLDPSSNLGALSIEDPAPDDVDKAAEEANLLGIDCALYYGGENFSESVKTNFAQFKYSPSDPEKAWTAARLTYSKAKTKNNSTFKRLADIFTNYNEQKPDGNWSISLVSNQPLDKDVCEVIARYNGKAPIILGAAVTEEAFQETYKILKTCTRFDDLVFQNFLSKLDFAACGEFSRYGLEASIISQLSNLTESESDSLFSSLFHQVYKLTLPEARNYTVTKETFISWFGLSSEEGLFPAPAEIKLVTNLVARESTQNIIDRIIATQCICLHGQGGFGKTTILQEIKDKLPLGSKTIVYDCYGGGTYLNSDKTRHGSKEAFTQLCNTLAVEMGTANFLVPVNGDTNYAQAFAKRLRLASEALARVDDKALLVIAIDAADNAITAAEKNNDKCFVADLSNLSTLPSNIKIVLSSRSGRLDSLKLPAHFEKVPLPAFSETETTSNLGMHFPNLSTQEIQEFHYLSRGIPRVQAYAIGRSKNDPVILLNLLRPNGKNLEALFEEQFQEAQTKAGITDIQEIAAILIGLPRPIPIIHVAQVANISPDAVLDICSDLAPGIQITHNQVDFADEDFESFIREKTHDFKAGVSVRIADYLFAQKSANEYAAFHVADALVETNKISNLLAIIQTELEPQIVKDILIKRQIITRRLALGLMCCESTENHAEAFKILIAAAEALKTEKAFFKLITDKPELAVAFADEAIEKSILRNKEYAYGHGPIRFHKALNEAHNKQFLAAKQSLRWAYQWVITKQSLPETETQGWDLKSKGAAAGIQTKLHLEGIEAAYSDLKRWRSKQFRIEMGLALIERLRAQGNIDQIEELAKLERLPTYQKISLFVPLLLAEKKIKKSQLTKATLQLARLPWNVQKVGISGGVKFSAKIFDLALTFLELSSLHGVRKNLIIQALNKIVPADQMAASKIYISSPATCDVRLRVAVLLEILNKKKGIAEKLLFPDYENPKEAGISQEEKSARLKKKDDTKEGQEITTLLLPLYMGRIRLFLQKDDRKGAVEFLDAQSSRIKNQSYRFRDYWYPAIISLALDRLAILSFCSDIDPTLLGQALINFSSWNGDGLGIKRIGLLKNLKYRVEFHSLINDTINKHIAPDIAKIPTSAEDKSRAYIRCAEMLLWINPNDAKHYFESAVEITKQIDEDAFDQIRVLEALSKKTSTLDFTDKRQHAHLISLFVADASIKLDGHEHFPWDAGVKAIAHLDAGIAIAAMGRWHDREIARCSKTVKIYIEHAVENGACSIERAASLSLLLSEGSGEISEFIAQQSKKANNPNHHLVGQELALDILIHTRPEDRLRLGQKLLPYYDEAALNTHLSKLQETTSFLESLQKSEHPKAQEPDYDLPQGDYSQADAILTAFSAFRASKLYDTAHLFSTMRARVSVAKRLDHLKALLSLRDEFYSIKTILYDTLVDWKDSPSIANWAKTELPTYTVENLVELTAYSRYNPSEITNYLEATGFSPNDIVSLILKALRHNQESLDAFQIYALLGIIGNYLTAREAQSILSFFIIKLKSITSYEEDDAIAFDTIPKDETEALGRFLYGLFGDANTRIRWKTAHTVRRLAKLKDSKLLSAVVVNANRIQENEFRANNLPFYWIAARQWLFLTLNRVANETAGVLSDHIPTIKSHALDRTFPHVIIRHFAQKTLLSLLQQAPDCMSVEDAEKINAIHKSPFPRVPRNGYGTVFTKRDEKRRFNFDSMDTLPSWYSRALRIFSTPKTFSFLDRAEFWLCDQWGIKMDEGDGKWLSEPRRNHDLMKRSYYSHKDGSRPKVERWSVYLEYHAMMCVVGEMLETYPLADEEFYDRWEDWIASHAIPRDYWMSDLKTAVPLQTKLWDSEAVDDAIWLSSVSASEMNAEIGIMDNILPDEIIIQSDVSITNRYKNEYSAVHSALVNPEVSLALLNALQTTRNYADFKIPDEDDDLEVNKSPYILEGWIAGFRDSEGIDDHDPYRNRASIISHAPGRKPSDSLETTLYQNNYFAWHKPEDLSSIFKYEAWSDSLDNDRDAYSLATDGQYLKIKKDALLSFLQHHNMHLILEATIHRSKNSKSHAYDDDGLDKRSVSDRIYLITPQGKLLTLHNNVESGKQLVRALGLDRSVDTLSRWMAHHLAQVAIEKTPASPITSEEIIKRMSGVSKKYGNSGYSVRKIKSLARKIGLVLK